VKRRKYSYIIISHAPSFAASCIDQSINYFLFKARRGGERMLGAWDCTPCQYNASVDFYWSSLQVESNSDHPLRHRIADRIVCAASINKPAAHWTHADVFVFLLLPLVAAPRHESPVSFS
jgi:hypothetical protein